MIALKFANIFWHWITNLILILIFPSYLKFSENSPNFIENSSLFLPSCLSKIMRLNVRSSYFWKNIYFFQNYFRFVKTQNVMSVVGNRLRVWDKFPSMYFSSFKSVAGVNNLENKVLLLWYTKQVLPKVNHRDKISFISLIH